MVAVVLLLGNALSATECCVFAFPLLSLEACLFAYILVYLYSFLLVPNKLTVSYRVCYYVHYFWLACSFESFLACLLASMTC